MIYKLAIALTILQVLDGWTTYQGLKYPSIYETMRLTKWCIARFGKYGGLLAAKSFATALIWWLALMPISEAFAAAALAGLSVYYAAIVLENWNNLKEAKK